MVKVILEVLMATNLSLTAGFAWWLWRSRRGARNLLDEVFDFMVDTDCQLGNLRDLVLDLGEDEDLYFATTLDETGEPVIDATHWDLDSWDNPDYFTA